MDNNDNVIQMVRTPEIFEKVDFIVNKSYLPVLERFPIVKLDDTKLSDSSDCTCFFPIKRIVFDKEENNLQKLASVYSSLSTIRGSVSMIIRGHEDGQTEIFMGVSDSDALRVNGAYPKTKAFQNSLFGNFPGCRTKQNHILNCEETRIAINNVFSSRYSSAASASCIGSLRGQSRSDKNSSYYQGIEKVIEAMNGKEYTILILAQPLEASQIQGIQTELEELYTNLSAFAQINLSANRSEANSASQSFSDALSESIGKSKSSSLSVGKNESRSESYGITVSTSGGANLGGEKSGINYTYTQGKSQQKGKIIGTNESTSQGNTFSINRAKTFNITVGTSSTETRGKSVTLNIENKTIVDTMNNITTQLQRIKSGSGIGLFATSAYFLSDSILEVRTSANLYKAVISGDNTSSESSSINVWCGEDFKKVLRYLKHFMHPVFQLSAPRKDAFLGMDATPATVVTAAELAVQMGLPQHSITGVPVTECIPFGRNVVKLSVEEKERESLNIGKIYHLGMGLNTPAEIDLDSLTMHTFITGTTGSGKSNTVYGLLNEVQRKRRDVPFLVVEPAKGEYKAAFADRNDVYVYGVNPYLTPLLRINPFRFHKGIHVLEHIDRLTSIFNVCWPMEAAMPAILKQAIERSYELAGWDLKRSRNRYSDQLFPAFGDVMYEVKEILNESQYSADNKGDYVGALCTRLRELTTGLNGMIFSSNDLEDEELFERNVIVDLSQIGSVETKALVMGLVVVRLQEYRQAGHRTVGSNLRHITVLEEAHNLLRRASQNGDSNGSNLVGKSVEILTNAFAEMRSAGEAFIIADQSPGVLDKAVIRNTNTKIVLRLPEFEDRELVGKAMGLSDAQITELSKLPTGVAAFYQNDWLESILVQVPYYESAKNEYSYSCDLEEVFDQEENDRDNLLHAIMLPGGIEHFLNDLEGDRVDSITRLHIETKVKVQIIRYLQNNKERELYRLGRIAFDFFDFQEVMKKTDTSGTLESWCYDVMELLNPSVSEFDEYDKETLLLLICSEYSRRKPEFLPIYLQLVEKIT